MITATILRDQSSSIKTTPKQSLQPSKMAQKQHQNNISQNSKKCHQNGTKVSAKWHQSFNALYLHHQPKWHQNGTRFCIVSSPSASSSPKSHAFCYLERIVVEKLHQDHINKNYREG